MNNQILFDRLRTLRKQSHYTQAFVSSKLNISRATYSNYERGKRTPSLDMVIALAKFYDVPFTYFFPAEQPDLTAASMELPPLPLSSPELELMNIYRSLGTEEQEQLLRFAVFLQNPS